MDTPLVEQGARFEQLIRFLGFNQTSFAEAFDDHQSNISKMIRGERGVPPKILLAMAKRHNVNSDWILTGEGDMINPTMVLAEDSPVYQKGEGMIESLLRRMDEMEKRQKAIEEWKAEVESRSK